MMKNRPILFSGPMVRAILEGRKTQTRRVMRPQPEHVWGWGVPNSDREHFCAHVRYPGQHQPDPWVRCPYGKPGDRLWVREAWTLVPATAYRASVGVAQTINPNDRDDAAIYRAGWDRSQPGVRWRPSIHMPRWASRITLEITGVRVERVQEISETDVTSEGISAYTLARGATADPPHDPRWKFVELWDALNGKRGHSWQSNPWVWVISFKRVQP